MLCLADIGEIWSLWRRFNGTQALGLVENQSDWYLGKLWKGQQPWPALGRGFNSGLILMDLAKLRSFTWMAFWRSIAELHLPQLGFTSLADQVRRSWLIREKRRLTFHVLGYLQLRSPTRTIAITSNSVPMECSTERERPRRSVLDRIQQLENDPLEFAFEAEDAPTKSIHGFLSEAIRSLLGIRR